MERPVAPPILRRAILAALWMTVFSLTATAQSLLYNTNGQPVALDTTRIWVSNRVATLFITGPAPSMVDSLTLLLRTFGNPTSSVAVGIYSGTLGTNLSLVGQLTGSPVPSGTNFASLTPAAPIPLSPNTHYWAIASSSASNTNNSYGWLYSFMNYTSAAGWKGFPEWGVSSDGVRWSVANPDIGGGLIFAVNGTIIPEPSEGLLLLCFTGGMLFIRFARR